MPTRKTAVQSLGSEKQFSSVCLLVGVQGFPATYPRSTRRTRSQAKNDCTTKVGAVNGAPTPATDACCLFFFPSLISVRQAVTIGLRFLTDGWHSRRRFGLGHRYMESIALLVSCAPINVRCGALVADLILVALIDKFNSTAMHLYKDERYKTLMLTSFER